MRLTRSLIFFLVAMIGIAFIAYRGVGEEGGDGPTTFETVLIVAAVLLGAHALRYVIYRLVGRNGPRD